MDPIVPEPPESPRLLRPRRVGEILVDAFRMYQRHWQNLIALVAVLVLPLALIQYFLSERLIRQNLTTKELRQGVEVVQGELAAVLLASLVIAVMSVLIWTTLTGAITRAAAGTFLGRDLDIAESYRFGFSRIGSIILVGILMGLAIVAGFILLVIPGFIVLTRMTAAIPALVIEDARGTAAIRRSWDLVRGNGWPVFGTIIVAGILTGLVSGILTAPFGDNWAARGLASGIASVITMPYTALVGILIYLDLRVKKEGFTEATLEQELGRTS